MIAMPLCPACARADPTTGAFRAGTALPARLGEAFG